MINKIIMSQASCYKNPATLETDKKVNLIYGLNGTGKSTVSDYLYNKSDLRFSNCSIQGLTDEDILVYNQSFIKDYFYEPDSLKGIFTLSKENKEAEKKVNNAEQEITKLETDKKSKADFIITHNSDLSQKKLNAENIIWGIKSKFTGGDRVLEYCLEGLKGQKDKLFNHLFSIAKPTQQPAKTTEQLKKEIEAIQGDAAQKYDLLPIINFTAHQVELDQLFQKSIIGNENSTVAELIKSLGNSDWVKKGLEYLPEEINNGSEPCPFCQERTITKTLIENIQNYFDKTYENDIIELKKLSTEYEICINSLPEKLTYESNPLTIDNKLEFANLYNAVIQHLNNNKVQIIEKLKTPSQIISLAESTIVINSFNQFINDINNAITEHNHKIDNKEASLSDIKDQFWDIMRWDYDQTLFAYQTDKNDIEKKVKDLNDEITNINGEISIQKAIVSDQQKMTVNIEEAIININKGLLELGIDCFRIEKYSDILYQIVREKECGNTFHTLSEGERMIISFLYFIELCKGKQNTTDTVKKKIVVIDDPVSSLSHIYVFNIGQLIKSNFTKPDSKYEQVFIFTHNLYFFYEIAYKKEDKELNMNLFRIIKNQNGSEIQTMKYNEIQNDYQSYWQIINDETQSPAIIANCMRNIIEYFFGFIEKIGLGEVFQKEKLRDNNKYQAFYRYMNRESHSIGQNIFDMKEFNYNDFKDAFKLVFEENGYDAHYKKMIK